MSRVAIPFSSVWYVPWSFFPAGSCCKLFSFTCQFFFPHGGGEFLETPADSIRNWVPCWRSPGPLPFSSYRLLLSVQLQGFHPFGPEDFFPHPHFQYLTVPRLGVPNFPPPGPFPLTMGLFPVFPPPIHFPPGQGLLVVLNGPLSLPLVPPART